jgi:aryl-alcohol dehydrogenase-like predicted oxidoreductase
MEQRLFGSTGLRFSRLGYGAGAVGGLMVRGTPAEREASIGRALAAGITYFDTAPLYGDGLSETHLGQALRALKADPHLGTKVRIRPEMRADLAGSIAASLEASLKRLGRDSVDLFQLHNPITEKGGEGAIGLAELEAEIVSTLEKLRRQGKARFIGITALGETAVLKRVVRSGAFQAAQIPFNLLNPTALSPMPKGLPGHDFAGLMRDCAAAGVGVIGIRILAGGALSGEEARHPIAMPKVAPIGSAPSYEADVGAARRLAPLVAEGVAGSLAELALRFAITPTEMGTALIGTASLDQLEAALAAAEKGPLSPEAIARANSLLAA